MSDDLVKRLRTTMKNVTVQACFKERAEAADCIEKLEAKLAKAVEVLEKIARHDTQALALNTLAELKGDSDG